MSSTTQARSWLAAGQQQGSRYHLALPRQAARGRTGLHLGVGRGSSVEFHEHREYQPGDDLRHLDWNVSARSDRLIVKLYREEVTPCCDLVVDGSRSMALPGTAKAAAVVGLAALLATAAEGTGWSHATWLTSEICEQLVPGALLAEAWPRAFAATANPAAALAGRPPLWRSHGVRVLISDLLCPGDPLPVLRQLAGGAAAVAVLHLVARHDLEPPQDVKNLRLIDVESNQQQPVQLDQAAARQYQRAMARHIEQWQLAARGFGVAFATLVAEPLVEHWGVSELVEIGLLQAAPR